MSKANREKLPRVNFFDGQRVTEADLDSEQLHHRSLVSNLTNDFHGSGVLRDRLFESRILLDTSDPGLYLEDDEDSLSILPMEAGEYDGRAIYLDRQPVDSVYGNRLELEASGLDIGGRISAKVLIVGLAYSSISDAGELVSEVIEFKENIAKVTEHYYVKVIAVFFNNFSGGVGKTEHNESKDSINTLSEDGKILIRESEPLKVFARTKTAFQTESPNLYLSSFITSSADLSIEDEIREAMGTMYSFGELYFELESSDEPLFEEDGDQTIMYGQKFLSKSDNIQKIDLLFHVERDGDAETGEEYNFSGDIVLSLHKLLTDIQCITDPHPDNLIDFDPDPSPIMEISYSQDDLAALGIKLDGNPQVIEFDLSGTLVADPGIDPTLEVDEYYAILVSRRGDNRTGTLAMSKGYCKPSRKKDNGQTLNAEEEFGKQTQRFIEFDPNNLVYVDDIDSSLWFIVHSDTVEMTDGMAYSDDGYPISVPKTVDYVGSTQISYFVRDMSLQDVSEGSANYLALYRQDNFIEPGIHPRTGNFVNTRIEDAPSATIITSDDLSDVDEDSPPIFLAKITDNNVRDAQDITGTFDVPGLIENNEIIFINPSTELLTSNLINRIITPDIECECNSRYRIVGARCDVVYAGDLDGDGEITSTDILSLLNIVGNTINAETTERKILGGEIDLLNFLQADLNEDGTVDGTDIELIEDAVDGYVNFTIDESFNVLRLKLENILEEDDFPELFNSADSVSSAGLGEAFGDTDEVYFVVDEDVQALAIRTGDEIVISSDSDDAGTYVVYSKVVDDSGLGVTLSVVAQDGDEALFIGSSGFDVEVISGTRVNTYADNFKLLNAPFSGTSWEISYIGSPHSEQFVDVCDLRRYVETNFIEEFEETCVCDPEACVDEEDCEPQYKNQKVLANDLFIPSGEIYKEPGVPYHGDIEYSTISITMPPGTIEDCEIDLYTNFIKSDSGKCKTESGYPAMLYSDGTYVGCEDSGAETDITKGRVKIKQCIASLYVDAFVDGYATDGYADETESSTSTEVITETFTDYSYPNTNGFSEWPITDPSGGTYFAVEAPLGSNNPATFILETINAGERTAILGYPDISLIDPVSGDFILDVVMSRAAWDQNDLSFGKISYYTSLVIENSDGTTSTLELGWRQTAYEEVEFYYSGLIEDLGLGIVISDFDYAVPATDDLGDEIRFRFRRVNEAVFGMYFDDTAVDLSANTTGQFIKIGENPDVQPGNGEASVSVELQQESNPNAGILYSTKLHTLTIQHSLEAESAYDEDSITISRDSDSIINKATITFPVLLTQRTNLISASLDMTVTDAISTYESFNVIPYNILNADNLGAIVDYPMELNDSFISTFIPGDLGIGDTITVDMTSIAIYFLSKTGHLPGFYKALTIEPSSTAEGAIYIDPLMTLNIEYEDVTTGVIFKVGASLDAATGIVSLQTKNILYDALNSANRTVLNFGVYLKKSRFRNDDVSVGIKDLERLGIGTCVDETEFEEDDLCYFIAGNTATGTFVEGPFPCNFHLP